MGTDDAVVSALWRSFEQIPAPTIPGMLDCVLVSTGIPPATLFASLLDSAASSLLALQDAAMEGKSMDSGQTSSLASMVAALCHLLKKIGKAPDMLESFIWRCLVPLVKALQTFEREIINKVLESFFDAVSLTDSWDVLGATLVPFSLRGVGLSAGMIQNEHTDVSDWGEGLASLSLGSSSTDNGLDRDSATSLPVPFPLPVSCHILTLILMAAQKRFQDGSTMGSELEIAYHNLEELFANLLWDLCSMTEHLLLQSLEHRSCAISFFLPAIFKAFIFKSSLDMPSSRSKDKLSSDHFFRKIWKCCVSLFSFGSLERKDAYCILSLYLSFFPCVNVSEEAEKVVGAENFDLRAEREFWDEIKRGLVDEEGLVRKQTLHVLKVALQISRENHSQADVSQKSLQDTNLISHGMTKKEMWAEKEAKSLGVGKFSLIDSSANIKQQWEAFLLLYEMLNEYGTHLVEAAWSHQKFLFEWCLWSAIYLHLHNSDMLLQASGYLNILFSEKRSNNRMTCINFLKEIKLLLQFCDSHDNFVTVIGGKIYQNQMENLKEAFSWLAILWQLGFRHENPLVRCLIMQSFLGVEWKRYMEFARSVPESFILGPLIDALNDPVHHSDFGMKGVYTSRTTEGASGFLHQYASCLHQREGLAFVHNLATTCKKQSFGRAGLMCLSECVASASSGVGARGGSEVAYSKDATLKEAPVKSSANQPLFHDKTDLLDALRYIVETSKQHFNPNYRLRVCEKVLEATASVLSPLDVPVEVVLHFISTIPREFTDYGGYLRERAHEWLVGCDKIQLLRSFQDFPERFSSSHGNLGTVSVNDGDLDAWESEARRWVRVLFLTIKAEKEFSPVVMFISRYGVQIRNPSKHFSPLKFLVLVISLVMEAEIMRGKACKNVVRLCSGDKLVAADASFIGENLLNAFLLIMEELTAFANTCSSIFWSNDVVETTLPKSVSGKLGGPSQRRLSSSNTAAVLQATTSMRAVVSVASWCMQLKKGSQLNSTWIFLWDFFWRIVSFPVCDSETGAELCLAAYEALAPILKALASTFSPVTLNLMIEHPKISSSALEDGCLLDPLLLSFSRHINCLLDVGVLARARRAVLLNCKWLCVESLLSIPCYAIRNGVLLEDNSTFFSDAAIRSTFSDIVESLENAGEGSALPMLRSVRLSLGLLASGNGVDVQMIWPLVRSSWILHANSKKRRIASLAALLSAVLHASIFADERMHFNDDEHGPLKWFVEHLLEEGAKSPRTIRLAALQLTGLWLQYPQTIKFYMKEMKLLTLYGSVAFDEDFEAELADNHDASTEVSVLAQSPDRELTEAFINTELYARVCVAVLFHKLADLVMSPESANRNDNSCATVDSGKLFLLELLDSAVNDRDLAKELYKKFSAIHRRKIRAWQMICVMSNFVTDDIVHQVTNSLHISLQRNNLPAIRQYLETFAINIYLKFPPLVAEQLVPILQDFEMRPQALSSYVFIAANIILHASEMTRSRHLDELLPPIIPLLTSHHHSLRGFTQLLLHQVFVKYFPPLDYGGREIIPLEKKGFEGLRLYLLKNPDCARLRSSMEGYLDAYDPIISCTPAGIFVNRVEEVQFECVPVSLMDEVLRFLNDVRDDLRSSMAKDVVMIKNESLKIKEDPSCRRTHTEPTLDSSLDFQKKITLHKHETRESNSSHISEKSGAFQQFSEIEKEDELLDQLFQSTNFTKEKLKASRQQLILVASLLDRIPNLAGLARTCEIFRASGLTVADKSILRDKQFQLISVTAEKWVPVLEVPVNSVKQFLEKKKHEGFSILGLEQTANSVPLDQYIFPKKTVLVLGREKEGIPVDVIHVLDACIEIPQLGVVRSLNVHVSGAIALWEYTRQQRSH